MVQLYVHNRTSGTLVSSVNMFSDPKTGVNETFHFPLMDERLIGDFGHILKKLSMILTLRIKERNISKGMYLKKITSNVKKINKESQIIWTQFPSFHYLIVFLLWDAESPLVKCGIKTKSFMSPVWFLAD